LGDEKQARDPVKVFYSDHFVLPLPEGHRFPMPKYSMLRGRVAASSVCGPGELREPEAVTDEEILRAHRPGYLARVVSGTLTEKEVRRIGFPWSERMVERSRRGPPAGRSGPAFRRSKTASPPTWRAAPTMPSPTAGRATASSTTPPSPLGPSRPRGSSSGWSS